MLSSLRIFFLPTTADSACQYIIIKKLSKPNYNEFVIEKKYELKVNFLFYFSRTRNHYVYKRFRIILKNSEVKKNLLIFN